MPARSQQGSQRTQKVPFGKRADRLSYDLKTGKGRGGDVVLQQSALRSQFEVLGSIPGATHKNLSSGIVPLCHRTCLKRQGLLGIVSTAVVLTLRKLRSANKQTQSKSGLHREEGKGEKDDLRKKEREKECLDSINLIECATQQSCTGKPRKPTTKNKTPTKAKPNKTKQTNKQHCKSQETLSVQESQLCLGV